MGTTAHDCTRLLHCRIGEPQKDPLAHSLHSLSAVHTQSAVTRMACRLASIVAGDFAARLAGMTSPGFSNVELSTGTAAAALGDMHAPVSRHLHAYALKHTRTCTNACTCVLMHTLAWRGLQNPSTQDALAGYCGAPAAALPSLHGPLLVGWMPTLRPGMACRVLLWRPTGLQGASDTVSLVITNLTFIWPINPATVPGNAFINATAEINGTVIARQGATSRACCTLLTLTSARACLPSGCNATKLHAR